MYPARDTFSNRRAFSGRKGKISNSIGNIGEYDIYLQSMGMRDGEGSVRCNCCVAVRLARGPDVVRPQYGVSLTDVNEG